MITADEYLLILGLFETHDIMLYSRNYAKAIEVAKVEDLLNYISGWLLKDLT